MVPAVLALGVGLKHRQWQIPAHRALERAEAWAEKTGEKELGLTAYAFKVGLLFPGRTTFVEGDRRKSNLVLCHAAGGSYRELPALGPRAGHAVAFCRGDAVCVVVPRLVGGLERVAKKHGVIGDIRGKGLFQGIEFVRNPATKEPFPGKMAFGVQVGRKALENGLLCRFDPNWIALGPPLVSSAEQIDETTSVLDRSLGEVLTSLAKS